VTAVAEAVPALRVEDVVVRFGGVTALDQVSFEVAPGSIHAVIGPNGAGKSTCFNVISGLYAVESGAVWLGERCLTDEPPHRLAGIGLGRAFQNVALSNHVTVLDNVMVGRHSLTTGGFLAAGLRLPRMRREQRRHTERAREICAFLGLADRLDESVGALSYGDRKRVDIGRALATEPSILMLDEPAAGMNDHETQEMAATIADIRDALGISVLLVEHDMTLVMSIADHITVLDFGRRIADGTPQEVRTDPEVLRAYLGSDADGTELGGLPTSSPGSAAGDPASATQRSSA